MLKRWFKVWKIGIFATFSLQFLSKTLWSRKWKWHFRLFRWTKPNFSFSHIPHLCWWILVGMLSTTVSMNKARFQFQSHTSRVLMNIGGNFINDCFDEQNLISVSVAYLTYAEEIFILHSCHYLSSVIALLCWKLVLRMIVWDQLPLFSPTRPSGNSWKSYVGVHVPGETWSEEANPNSGPVYFYPLFAWFLINLRDH